MMTFTYLLNPAKVGCDSKSVTIADVSHFHEHDNFIEVCYLKDDEDHDLYIKKDDILLYETY